MKTINIYLNKFQSYFKFIIIAELCCEVFFFFFAHNATYNTILSLRDLKTTWQERESEESFWFIDT